MIPIEIQLEVYKALASSHPPTLASVACVSKTHNKLVTPLLFQHIAIRDRFSLEAFAATLVNHPQLARHVRTFFFQGPQGRRTTGRDALALLDDEEEEHDGADQESENDDQEMRKLRLEDMDEMKAVELEAGVEGEGQEATWDEHESLMHLCTLVLRQCSGTLHSVGFVDCVPWFLAPTEGVSLNFPLPVCHEFTGVTVGLFGLLPHLQRKPTSLRRIHLIGGDFGSFALQRILVASPSAHTLTHLHITAPTLYRAENHTHLVKHIRCLLDCAPRLQRISVGIIHWLQTPPSQRAKRRPSSSHNIDEPALDDDRLLRCRQAYMYALPEALQQSARTDVSVALVKVPFVQGSPVGFAGWIMKHHRRFADEAEPLGRKEDVCHAAWLRRWQQRDLSQLPNEVSSDGTPKTCVWDLPVTLEWTVAQDAEIHLSKGSIDTW